MKWLPHLDSNQKPFVSWFQRSWLGHGQYVKSVRNHEIRGIKKVCVPACRKGNMPDFTGAHDEHN
jgi:hypothetical protein